MNGKVQVLLTAATMAAAALLILLTSVALVQSGAQHRGMRNLVEVTGRKAALLSVMQNALWQETATLVHMQRADSGDQRHKLYKGFSRASNAYHTASKKLARLGTMGGESGVRTRLAAQERFAVPYFDSTARLILDGASPTLVTAAMRDVTAQRDAMAGTLDNLAEMQQTRAGRALAASGRQDALVRRLLPGITLLMLVITGVAYRTVSRHLSEKQRQLAYHSSHDPLTGLINRSEFEARLDRIIAQTREKPATHALLYLDLDQFRLINDSCSHTAGDQLLRQIAGLLLGMLRQRDTLGRLGGDEFGLLLENCPLGKAVEIAGKLQKAVDQFQFTRGESVFRLGASIGVVAIDEHSLGIASVLSAADAACYIAKESGRNRVQIAHLGDRRMQRHQGEMQWATRLEKALAEDRLALYYQPVVPCAGGGIKDRHIEILLRLIDEDGTVIRPGSFMPAAEKYNLAAQIDRWVVSRMLDWQSRYSGDGYTPPTITVNLSAQSLHCNEMLKFIIDRSRGAGISPRHVIFEVSETKAVNSIQSATNFMLTLRGCGFRFSLDKFGSGPSTFSYLKKLPIDYLKIDGSFVRDIQADPVDFAMVRSLNELGQLLGKETIAEHVESLDIAEELRSIGINYAQGCAYATPAPLNNFVHGIAPRLVVVSS